MKLFVLLAGLLAVSTGTLSQNADWPVIERCVGDFTYPSVPPARWDFEGTIISVNDEGVRAIQTGEPQQYFVALSAAESFPEYGAFSPDGTHFAYLAVNGGKTVLKIEPVGIDSDTVYVAWDFELTSGRQALPRPLWFSSAVVHIQSNIDGEWYAIDRTEPESITRIDAPVAASLPDAVSVHGAAAYSPDGRYIAYVGVDTNGGADTLHYADLEKNTLYDLCIALDPQPLPFMAWSPDSTTLAFTIDGFPVLLDVTTAANRVLRYETGRIMQWLPPLPVFKEGRG